MFDTTPPQVEIVSPIPKTYSSGSISIDIRLNNKIRIPDAIIAATAEYLKIPIISADKQFKQVKEINLIYYQV
ncbi:MAG: PIN domain-containing protein [Bacteroidetes bacterium]|nr:PIN domain-containing protein [Bacteroidota bacterium]